MGPRRFCIVLDNPSAAYFPGQVVTGKVDFCIEENTKLQGIILTPKCESKAHWREYDSFDECTFDFASQESYFSQRLMLLYQGGDTFELAPGNYQYPFSFQLPLGLPSSFEGEIGHIRYTIKASAQRPWEFDFETKVAITVNAIVDLNTIPEANESAQDTDSKTLCCWCCTSGPISTRVSIAKRGHVPGQSILFSAQVDNKTGVTIMGSKVQLIQRVTYSAKLRYETSTWRNRVLTEQVRGPFRTSETWDRVPVVIPPVVPTNFTSCKNIKVEYYLKFSVDLGFSILKVPLNVIIGNVPLRCDFPMFRTPSAPVDLSAVPAEAFPKAAQYADLPPPCYEQVTTKTNIREKDDCDQVQAVPFAPRYLTYETKK